MNRLISWFASNGVAANLLMGLIVLGGLLTAPRIKREVFPEVDIAAVNVSVIYPGATPAEIEESINIRIEEKISGLEGVKRITSTAAEGAGAVVVEALQGTDIRALLDDVKSQVDSIDTFPDEAERPVTAEVVRRDHVLTVAVWGDIEEPTLKKLAERVRDDLTSLPDVSLAELANVRPYEISIELREDSLRRFGLSFDDVATAVRRSSIDLPGGAVRSEGGEVLLRTKGQAYVGRDFEELILRTERDGTRLSVGDVARVVDGFADGDNFARYNRNPAAMVQVYRVGDESVLDVAAAVHEYILTNSDRLPPGVTLSVFRDSAEILADRIDTLRRNGLQGLVLVFIMLALFLQLRLAMWVTIGIPISFLGTLWVLPAADVSINMLSLFCFILVLGIVVDDAIIIGENVYRKREEGVDGATAVTEGAQEVAIPVIFGVLTTVVAFGAMLGLPGATGKIMRVFPLTVIPALLFSLIESQLILPAHLRHVISSTRREGRGISAYWYRLQGAFVNGLDVYVRGVYQPLLSRALEWRYAVLAAAIGFLFVTLAMAMSGRVPLTYFPNVEADNVASMLTMPLGTTREVTGSALLGLESAAKQVEGDLRERFGEDAPGFVSVITSLGDQPFRTAQGQNGGSGGGQAFSGAHVGEVVLQLTTPSERPYPASLVQRLWRDRIGEIPGATELAFTSSLFSAGKPLEIRLAGNNVENLQAAAARLKETLAAYPGVFDVADSFRPGKRELVLSMLPEAEAVGLTLADLARQVRQGFYGEEAQRVQRGREDVKVMVRYPEAERRNLATLEDMRIRTASGDEVPFSKVATVTEGRGFATISRADRRRVLDVTADVDPALGNANQVLTDLRAEFLPQLLADYGGLTYSLEGEQREQRETLERLARGFAIALLVIYALMAIPLRSYSQPFLVMSTIPFGVVGAVWAHLLLGLDVSFLSIFGTVALVGVVVNDSLVLVDYVNRHRYDFDTLAAVVRAAGSARFRAILLTSITTFAGLFPLLLERSLQAQFLIPMAVSLGCGVVFATVVTLVLVPCGYLVVEDIGDLYRRWRGLPPVGMAAPLTSASDSSR